MALIHPSSHTPILRRKETKLVLSFSVLLTAFIAAVAFTARPSSIEAAVGAASIVVAAATPTWLWITRRVKGWPIMPIFAAITIPTFALPLLYEHPIVMAFAPGQQLLSALTVTGFLVLTTITWAAVMRGQKRRATRFLVLNDKTVDNVFIVALGISTLITFGASGHSVNLPAGIGSIVVAIAGALTALSSFVLSYRAGTRELRGPKQTVFVILFMAALFASLPGMLLVSAIATTFVSTIGFVLGARRFPWLPVTVAICAFAFLHQGKANVRRIYWAADEDPVIGLLQYPAFLFTWIQSSINNIAAGNTAESGEENQSLLERASLMQLLLYVQSMTPGEVPYLGGETYAVIPRLLVPRILDPDKPASHEGTYLLNIAYGFQTREATEKTTIGFGLLNEAFANFGYEGVAGLAVILGLYYGFISRWAFGAPILSFRSLFAILVTGFAIQTEHPASVYVTELFQSTVALSALAFLFMRTRPVLPGEASMLE